MIASKYNLVFKINDGDLYFVFNTLRLCAAFVPDYFNVVASAESSASSGILQRLRQLGLIVSSVKDEENELVSKVILERFPPYPLLGLTICPTLNCPLSCPYCYQRAERTVSRRSWSMTRKVEDALVKFVEANLKERSGLSIIWYGGEPLLRWKQFTRLSKRLQGIVRENGKKYVAGIVTSGWGLDENKLGELTSEHGVKWIQITLEMPPRAHEERRLGPNGENLLPYLVGVVNTASKHMVVLLRLNIAAEDVTPETSDEITSFLGRSGILDNPNVDLSPCPIDDSLYMVQVAPETYDSDVSFGRAEGVLEAFRQVTDSILEVKYERQGCDGCSLMKRLQSFYRRGSCCAVRRDAFLVLPDGKLQKCWSTVGHDREDVGSVFEGVALSSSSFTKWLSFSLPDFGDCVGCAEFPICLGGCAFYRLHSYPRPTYRCLVGFVETLAQIAALESNKYFGYEHVEVTLVTDRREKLPAYLRTDFTPACEVIESE